MTPDSATITMASGLKANIKVLVSESESIIYRDAAASTDRP